MLLNTWKHHAEWVCEQILIHADAGSSGLETLAEQLHVVGTDLMDFYFGDLSVGQIAENVNDHLRNESLSNESAYRDWLDRNKGYVVIPFSHDESKWVLLPGEKNGRYVHLHPARYSPMTCRVRANVLKTAVMVSAYAKVHKLDPLDVQIVNEVRERYLNLSPVPKLKRGEGLRPMIELLL